MKMRKIMFLTVGLFFALASVSCEKDDYSPSAKRLLPSKIVSTQSNAYPPNPVWSETIWEFKYDSENRIMEMKNYFIYNGEPYGEQPAVSYFSYDGDNITVTSDGVTKYYVRKGSVIEATNNGSPQVQTIEIDGKLRSKTYSYDAKGNVKYHDGRNLGYDRENGVFKHVNMPPWYLTNVFGTHLTKRNLYNNCSEALKDKSGYGYSMEYNEDNYPISISQIPIGLLGGGTESYEIQYIEAN